MEQNSITLGRLSLALSYRDLKIAFSSFFANASLKNIAIIKKDEIIQCIQKAIHSTPIAVIHQSLRMAASNNSRCFFQSVANHASLSASSANLNTRAGFAAM